MGKKATIKSTCCYAKIRIAGDITKYAICEKCNKPCNVTFVPRRQWQRNPVAQIQPNKKRKKIEKLIEKEIRNG